MLEVEQERESPGGLDAVFAQLVVDSGATAGAVCLWTANRSAFHVAVSVGLTPSAVVALTAAPGGPRAWQPLVDATRGSDTIIVPATADTGAPAFVAGQTRLACVPLRHMREVIGVVVLIATDAAPYWLDRLAALDHQIREVAYLAANTTLPTSRGSFPGLGPIDGLATLLLGHATAAAGEARRLIAWLQGRPVPDASLPTLDDPAAHWQARAEQLQIDLTRVRVDLDAQWQARLGDVETAEVRERLRAQSLEREIERLTGELAETVTRERRLRDELDTTITRGTQSREETLQHARDLTSAAEKLRATAAAEAQAAGTALATVQAEMLSLQEDLRRARADTEQSTTAERVARDEIGTLRQELVRQREQATSATERAQRVETTLAALRSEREQFENYLKTREAWAQSQALERLAQVQAACARQRDQLLALETEREQLGLALTEATELGRRLQAERDTARTRLAAEREDILGHAHGLTDEAERARATLATELDYVRTALAQAQAMLFDFEEAALADDASRGDALERARQATHRAEEQRAAVTAELEDTRRLIAKQQVDARAAETAVVRAQQDLEALRSEVAQGLAERQRLTSDLLTARSREAQAATRLDQLEHEIETLTTERRRLGSLLDERDAGADSRWQARLVTAEAALTDAEERIRQLDADHARMASDLDAATERERRARQELASIIERGAEDREETIRHARELAAATEEARSTAVGEVEALRSALAVSQRTILEAEEETRRAQTEVERLSHVETELVTEQRRLAATLEDARARELEATTRAAELEEQVARLRRQGTGPAARPAASPSPARPNTTPPAAPAAPTVPAAAAPEAAPAADPSCVAVLDVDPLWSERAAAGTTVVMIAPGDGLAETLQTRRPKCLVVNLTHPAALAAASVARAATTDIRIVGCLAKAGEDAALMVGTIEAIQRPAEPEDVIARVNQHSRSGTRILVAIEDPSTAISIRQALTRGGRSVSVAWDTKQADELVEIVRPQVVVLDIGLSPRGMAMLAARAAAGGTPPTLVLLVPETDPSDAFMQALATTPNARAFTRTALLTDVLRERRPEA